MHTTSRVRISKGANILFTYIVMVIRLIILGICYHSNWAGVCVSVQLGTAVISINRCSREALHTLCPHSFGRDDDIFRSSSTSPLPHTHTHQTYPGDGILSAPKVIMFFISLSQLITQFIYTPSHINTHTRSIIVSINGEQNLEESKAKIKSD